MHFHSNLILSPTHSKLAQMIGLQREFTVQRWKRHLYCCSILTNHLTALDTEHNTLTQTCWTITQIKLPNIILLRTSKCSYTIGYVLCNLIWWVFLHFCILQTNSTFFYITFWTCYSLFLILMLTSARWIFSHFLFPLLICISLCVLPLKWRTIILGNQNHQSEQVTALWQHPK